MTTEYPPILAFDPSDRTSPSSCGSNSIISQADFKLAADPYFYYTLDTRHSKTAEQELIDLKLQVARQHEKIDMLSSKVSQYEVENAILKAEKTALVDELTHIRNGEQQSSAYKANYLTNYHDDKEKEGPHKQRDDTVAELMAEISRLQALSDVTRKSFQSYVKDSRRRRSTRKVKARNNRKSELEIKKLQVSSCEDGLAKTSSLESIEITEPTIDDSFWAIEGVNIEAIDDSVVDRNVIKRGQKSGVHRRHSKTVVDTRNKPAKRNTSIGEKKPSGNSLLVGFGDRRGRRASNVV